MLINLLIFIFVLSLVWKPQQGYKLAMVNFDSDDFIETQITGKTKEINDTGGKLSEPTITSSSLDDSFVDDDHIEITTKPKPSTPMTKTITSERVTQTPLEDILLEIFGDEQKNAGPYDDILKSIFDEDIWTNDSKTNQINNTVCTMTTSNPKSIATTNKFHSTTGKIYDIIPTVSKIEDVFGGQNTQNNPVAQINGYHPEVVAIFSTPIKEVAANESVTQTPLEDILLEIFGDEQKNAGPYDDILKSIFDEDIWTNNNRTNQINDTMSRTTRSNPIFITTTNKFYSSTAAVTTTISTGKIFDIIPKMVDECGLQNVQYTNLTTNNEARIGEYPWMVAILKRIKNKRPVDTFKYICGGVIISPFIILTVANCVHNKTPSQLKIIISGDNNVNDHWANTKHSNNINVREIIFHEEFRKKHLFNNIAILILSNPIKFNDNVNRICLPLTLNDNFDNQQNCLLSGFGENANNLPHTKLKHFKISIISNDRCSHHRHQQQQGHMKRKPLNQKLQNNINTNFICGGGGGVGGGVGGGDIQSEFCIGMIGSPLVCPIPNTMNRYVLAGMVLKDICNDPVGSYVKVSTYRNWIDQKIAEKHL